MSKFNKDFIQYNDKKVKDETHSLAFYLSTRIVFYIVLLFFAIFFIWYTAFISTHSFFAVSGVSMMGTLNSQISSDRLNSGEDLQKVSYDAVYIDKTTKAKLFDIIVINRPQSTSIVKRLMAQEGDYITISKSQDENGVEHFYFYRIPKSADLETFTDADARIDEESGENGYKIYGYSDWDKLLSTQSKVANGGEHIYEENFYLTFLSGYFAGEDDYTYHVSDEGLVYVQVPEGKFFYMGDNRAHSTDARAHGFCDVSYIVGRTEFIVYNYNFGNRLLEVVKFYFEEVGNFFAR